MSRPTYYLKFGIASRSENWNVVSTGMMKARWGLAWKSAFCLCLHTGAAAQHYTVVEQPNWHNALNKALKHGKLVAIDVPTRFEAICILKSHQTRNRGTERERFLWPPTLKDALCKFIFQWNSLRNLPPAILTARITTNALPFQLNFFHWYNFTTRVPVWALWILEVIFLQLYSIFGNF